MKKQYRYVMSGTLCPTDGGIYEINIPSPFKYNSKERAMKDGAFGYRFILLNDEIGPEIVIFEREKCELSKDEKYLNISNEAYYIEEV